MNLFSILWVYFKKTLGVSNVQKNLEDVEQSINDLAFKASKIDKEISNLKRGMNVSEYTIDLDKINLKIDIQSVINTLETIKIKVDSM